MVGDHTVLISYMNAFPKMTPTLFPSLTLSFVLPCRPGWCSLSEVVSRSSAVRSERRERLQQLGHRGERLGAYLPQDRLPAPVSDRGPQLPGFGFCLCWGEGFKVPEKTLKGMSPGFWMKSLIVPTFSPDIKSSSCFALFP